MGKDKDGVENIVYNCFNLMVVYKIAKIQKLIEMKKKEQRRFEKSMICNDENDCICHDVL